MGHPNAISLFDVTSRYPMPPLLNATSKVGSRLSFKFVVPYEKIFATFPRMPYRRRSSSMCSAIGTDGFRCNETSLEGRWCIRHQEVSVIFGSNSCTLIKTIVFFCFLFLATSQTVQQFQSVPNSHREFSAR